MAFSSSPYSPFCCKCLLTSSSPYSSSRHSFRSSVHLNIQKIRKFKVPSKLPKGNNFLRADMNSSSISFPSLPEQRIVVGCGTISTDYLASVAAFPQPDEKIRSTALQVQGGGNVGNALTGAARLGLNPRIISKVSETGNSPFTYVIVDTQMKTRTCIHSPGTPPIIPEDLPASTLLSALTGARIVYFDGRLPEVAHIVAKEARRMELPILVDAERKREGLDELLTVADYVVCSAKFPQAWTEAPSVASALLAMALRLPRLKFVIVTLGEAGCIMLEKSMQGTTEGEILDVDTVLESLQKKVKGLSSSLPISVSSETIWSMLWVTKNVSLLHTWLVQICQVMERTRAVGSLEAVGIGKIYGRLLVGTTEAIPPLELIDTTGAGDGFIGAVLYALIASMPPERMLPFAAKVAAAGCRALGARTGLPYRTDSQLVTYL